MSNLSYKIMAAAITAVSLISPQDSAAGGVTPSASQPEKTTDTQTTQRTFTPEALWDMNRIGAVTLSPDGNTLIYALTHYSVSDNKGTTHIYTCPAEKPGESRILIENANNPAYIANGRRIAFLSSRSGSPQVWTALPDGTDLRQLTHSEEGVSEFLFSPDNTKLILIRNIPFHEIIAAPEPDLPKASGMVINDLMYKHWDQYVTEIPHPFLVELKEEKVVNEKDILAGEPYECPMLPFGGIEQLAWSPDSKTIAYTCRKKVGKAYAISTDSDIYLYDTRTGATRNLCKPDGYVSPEIVETRSLEHQEVNKQDQDVNAGYDQNPQFSPDGRYIAWTSMERDGYESDRTRLCVYELATGSKTYVTESFRSGVNEFIWSPDSRTIYFTGVWRGRTNIYAATALANKDVRPLTADTADYTLSALSPKGDRLIVKRHSMSRADEIYTVKIGRKNTEVTSLTAVNDATYRAYDWGEVRERIVPTSDGKEELCWVIYPPQFDASKKYPVLLFCEGGPQSPVSQFWSYRWNFQVMAAQGYIVIAPNRRGLPGFGMEWLEQISGDYSGQCMRDYLSAIDDLCREPYVDRTRLGAVGASFGGYSVYWLAGNHDKRFKCFIAHDGIFNTQQQYLETEEMWFPNWDLGSAPWEKDTEGKSRKAYTTSPHLYVDRWDTPILCIHGQRDFRIEYTQAESAFAAARLRGIDAQLLLFPDENHWVLKPQNGILWQRTFFRWLGKYLK